MREYSDMIVYDWFNNPFFVDCGSPDLNIPRIPIGDSPRPNKRDRYGYNMLTAAISVTPGYFVSKLTTPSDYPQIIEPDYYDPVNLHTIMSDNPCGGMMTRGYCSSFHDGIIC